MKLNARFHSHCLLVWNCWVMCSPRFLPLLREVVMKILRFLPLCNQRGVKLPETTRALSNKHVWAGFELRSSLV